MKKQIEGRTNLYVGIRKDQYEFLRHIAYKKGKSLSEIAREAFDVYMEIEHKNV